MDKDNIPKDKEVNRPDNVVDFILAKNERLTSAVYMITALLGDQEPLKWKLRELALKLLSDLPLSLISSSGRGYKRQTSYKYANTEGVLVSLDDMLSLIAVAIAGGSVSQMNFTILQKEYEALKNSIATTFSTHSFQTYLLSGGEHLLPQATFNHSFSHLNNTKNESELLTQPNQTVVKNNSESYLPTVKDKTLPPKQVASPKTNNPKNNPQGQVKNDRQTTIVEYLKGHSWASIKDIAGQIPDCSSKTVQRELVELVNTGVLQKTGDRRWSRYAVAK
ncbi:MAG: hypothetical protein WDZ73_01870 [Candidatus Paceibacterota bacterium]